MTAPTDPDTPQAAPPHKTLSENKGVIRAATVLSMGNIVSRVMGLARDAVLVGVFGAPLVSAYETATLIPNQLYELIVGGMVNSSLVPVFSEYALPERRKELWAIVSAFLSVMVVVLIVLVLLVELFAVQIAGLAGANNFDDPRLTIITVDLLRIAAPAILTLGLASIITGVLYARKQFTVPAFLPALFNGAIVLVVLIRPNSITSAVYGLLIGSTLQIVVQLPAIRDAKLRWDFNWRHPVIRRIIKLYIPIVAGLVISAVVITISINLANRTGDSSVTYMRRATTLMQFPLGLVVTALSIAILPTLSQQASAASPEFKSTLAGGIRLVLALIMPATLGLFALAQPIVDLLFGHGAFTAGDVDMTALVLRVYLIGLPFAAVDQMLVFAFYAGKDTWRPAVVGVISLIFYMIVAVGALWVLSGNLFHAQMVELANWLGVSSTQQLGLLSLMIADAVKHMSHMLMMVWLQRRTMGGLDGYGILKSLGKATVAATASALAAFGVGYGVAQLLPVDGFGGEVLVVGLAGAAGVAVYAAFVYALDLREIRVLLQRVKKR
jgi:putative peptidoglycan lipid II flippase